MPSFTIPGLSTGQNTNDLVRKLVEVESKPIKRWEKENEHNKVQMRAWNELKNHAVNLQIKVKALTSFTAPFASKKIIANEEGFLTGEASKGAKVAKQEIEIAQLATKHKVAGTKIKLNSQLPAGNFTIVSKDRRVTIEFPGGDLEKLAERIRSNAQTIAKPSITKVDSENQVLSLSAVQFGKDAELKFLDENGVLSAAGLVGGNIPEPPPSFIPVNLAPESPVPYQPEKFPLSKEPTNAPAKTGGGILIKPNTAFQFSIQKWTVEKSSILEFTPSSSADGKLPDYIGLGVVYETKEGEKTKYVSADQKNGKYSLAIHEFAKDSPITKVILANTTDREIAIQDFKIKIPPNIQGAPATNVLVEAQDAIFKIDGIEITRDTNENIKDAIEGTSLTLMKVTQNPLTIDITADTTKAVTMMREFVESYNSLMKYSRDITTTNREDKIDLSNAANDQPGLDISADYWSNKLKNGILAGETAVIRLATSLKSASGASYPSNTEPRFKALVDIGISTGDPGASLQQTKEGYLVINETSLQTALTEYPESVKELFASDTNSDNKPDDGVGISILEILKPYTQFTSGIVSTKVKLAETQIQDNNKRIKDYEGHLSNYEKKLKQRFEYMEQGVQKNKNIGNYLNNSIKQMKANNERE
ncbi:MAG: flagellar filament capping protein FliD [Leptospiraceae bacterium]|nr:flagellar filament capping protein FliD [Leptospiraceae bacterium]